MRIRRVSTPEKKVWVVLGGEGGGFYTSCNPGQLAIPH